MTVDPRFLAALRSELAATDLLTSRAECAAYECDALTAHRRAPDVVVLPRTTAQVQAILRLARAHSVPVVARGAGTGLSGGAMPMSRAGRGVAALNRILEIDPKGCIARVQCGVRNLAISEAAAPYGLYYAPDPSSQLACTIGGNVAENSGGVHCLKYGLTVHNVLGIVATPWMASR